MTPRNVLNAALAGGLMLALAPAARAENWVKAESWILVDVDGIREHKDGLVYYREKFLYKDQSGPHETADSFASAVDCRNRITYQPELLLYERDWRSKGMKVIPGSMGEDMLDFVCKRVK